MSAPRPIFNNHNGTTSSSFNIGKSSGISLIYGTTDPEVHELTSAAPSGSLYFKQSGSTSALFQKKATTWVPILASGSTSYRQTFTNDDLDNGVLTVMHYLAEDFPFVQVYTNTRELATPDGVISTSSNVVEVNLVNYGNIPGNWTVICHK